MASFATTAELATLLQRTITVEEDEAAALMIEMVSAEIQRVVRQQIESVTDDTVTIQGNWTPHLLLPQRPVNDIASISISTPYTADLELGPTSYQWTRTGKVTLLWAAANWPTEAHGNWGGPDSTVTVTYDHGYDETPPDIRSVCLRAAMRMMQNPQMLVSESVGGYYSYTIAPGADPSAVLLPGEEKMLKSAYRKMTA